ncbi:cytochrome P450 [Bradyrhizobium sp. RDI18]|uniref:cytochrome P450 n=1 Tax=Bradyrhizobium sp. RDI18 TaxID=3367400 RepID=UPI00371C3943
MRQRTVRMTDRNARAPQNGKSLSPSRRMDRVHEAALFAISPDGQMDEAGLQAAFTLLRSEAPVYWVECPGMRPFWLVSRHADIMAVEARGAPFIAAPRSVLSSEAGEASIRQISGKPEVLRSLFQMDKLEHRAYREIAQAWFSKPGVGSLEALATHLARQFVRRIPRNGEAFDFAREVAVPFPLRLMMHILGLPEADDPLILKLARGLTGAEDPGRALSDRPAESIRLAGIGFREYFNKVTADRRLHPRADLSSVIANACVFGKPIADYERLSYFIQLAIAGQENTAYSIAGGLEAMLTHPDQMTKLVRDPTLLETAVEEILRWTSPGRHLVRTATTDTKVGGQRIRAGEAVALLFASANHDETVFDSAHKFEVDRQPNPHLAFGSGPHFCLGVHLARLELRALFEALMQELPRISSAGAPIRARSAVISGISSLPVRWA